MADVSKIKASNGTEYTIKDNSQVRSNHRHYETDLAPTISKVYTSTSYYSTNNSWDNSTWYFMSVKPDTYYKPWKVKFRVHSFCPSYSNVESVTWASLSGRADSFTCANFNENYDRAHYYVIACPIKQAGLTAGYGHAIGISIRYGANYQNSAYYRTFEVDYYSCENCTVTILDTPVKWADWPGNTSTNYGSLASMDAASRGLQESGDSDTLENRITYFSGKTGAKGVWAYSLFMEDGSGTYQNICTATDGTVTANNRTTGTKIANTNGFRVGGPIYYCNSDYNANTNITGWGNVYKTMSAFDSRYSLNTTLTANCLTPYAPIYLVGTINSTDGLFYLDSTWWTQTPTTTGKVYILLGACYDSTTSNCRITLYEQNKWYKYNGSRLVEFVDNSLTVNGYSVNKSVPSNAVFTDTTYTLGTSGNNVTLTPSSGSAQSITVPYSTLSNAVYGIYTTNGGQQPPNYFGTNRAGFLMSNASVAGDSHYKNWLYMDNYNGSDVGGATAIGVDRTEPRMFIMQSDANRTSWNNTAAVGVFTATPTSGQVVTTDGTTGGIKSSGYTIATSVPSGAVFTDTKNTAGSTDTSSKIYLIGATSQAANPQTYSDNEVYATSGVLTTKSVQVGGGSASLVYDANTQAINFVFS